MHLCIHTYIPTYLRTHQEHLKQPSRHVAIGMKWQRPPLDLADPLSTSQQCWRQFDCATSSLRKSSSNSLLDWRAMASNSKACQRSSSTASDDDDVVHCVMKWCDWWRLQHRSRAALMRWWWLRVAFIMGWDDWRRMICSIIRLLLLLFPCEDD